MTTTASLKPNRAALMVPDAAAILKRLYFLNRELVLMQAGWLPGTVHWQTKLLLPEMLWEDALTTGALRQRVLELRFPEREIDLAPDENLVAMWKVLRDAPDSYSFTESLRLVIKPFLREHCQRYLDLTDHLDDGPTVRLLTHAVQDLDSQMRRLNTAAEDARTAFAKEMAATQKWVESSRQIVAKIGDLLDPAPRAALAIDPAALGARPFAINRQGVRDTRFFQAKFAWPDGLDPKFGAGEGLQLRVRQATHHLNEIWAAEMAGACLFDLADKGPFDFFLDAARWCYDEIRHCRMGFTRLTDWGFKLHQMPLGNFSYAAGADADAITRLGIIFYFESTYIHTKSQRMRIFGAEGDRVSSHDMDFDWADEQIHAHYGTRWLKYFLEQSGDTRRPVDFRPVSEACIQKVRSEATEKDRQHVKAAFDQAMSLAKTLLVEA